LGAKNGIGRNFWEKAIYTPSREPENHIGRGRNIPAKKSAGNFGFGKQNGSGAVTRARGVTTHPTAPPLFLIALYAPPPSIHGFSSKRETASLIVSSE
jgi:hypothetical protein